MTICHSTHELQCSVKWTYIADHIIARSGVQDVRPVCDGRHLTDVIAMLLRVPELGVEWNKLKALVDVGAMGDMFFKNVWYNNSQK